MGHIQISKPVYSFNERQKSHFKLFRANVVVTRCMIVVMDVCLTHAKLCAVLWRTLQLSSQHGLKAIWSDKFIWKRGNHITQGDRIGVYIFPFCILIGMMQICAHINVKLNFLIKIPSLKIFVNRNEHITNIQVSDIGF